LANNQLEKKDKTAQDFSEIVRLYKVNNGNVHVINFNIVVLDFDQFVEYYT
jgi:hypothetical protein